MSLSARLYPSYFAFWIWKKNCMQQPNKLHQCRQTKSANAVKLMSGDLTRNRWESKHVSWWVLAYSNQHPTDAIPAETPPHRLLLPEHMKCSPSQPANWADNVSPTDAAGEGVPWKLRRRGSKQSPSPSSSNPQLGILSAIRRSIRSQMAFKHV